MPIVLDKPKCIESCRLCEEICPGDVISMVDNYPQFRIEECWHCGACEVDCPTEALKVELWFPC